MATVLQIELKHYIENHEFKAEFEGNGIVFGVPVIRPSGAEIIEYSYVETYRQARDALGY